MKSLFVLLFIFTACLAAANPPEILIGTDRFPHNGIYFSPEGLLVGFPNGIAFRNVTHSECAPPFSTLPLTGFSQSYTYTSIPRFEISLDNGLTWNWTGPTCTFTTRITHDADTGQTGYFSVEVLQMDIAGGSLPAGVFFRESPTLASASAMTVRSDTDGYHISSFFDIFTEVTVDAGMTWTPAATPLHLELYYPVHHSFASDHFPPDGSYDSPSGTTILWASGIAIRNIIHRAFSSAIPLPGLGNSAGHSFTDAVSFEISSDGMVTWLPVTAPGSNSVSLNHVADDGSGAYFNVDVLQMNISGGDLPPGLMIRESPTIASRGKYNVLTTPPGYLISSFFDVFLELSLDAGMSWQPANRTIRLELAAGCPAISITPTFLPVARKNELYSVDLAAGGGVAPYSFSVISGELQSGLVLAPDGHLTGTPEQSGVEVLVVQVTDSNLCAASQTCTLAVMGQEFFTGGAVFPPAGKFVAPTGAISFFPVGILIRNMIRREISPVNPLPGPGSTQTYMSGGSIDFEMSMDGGISWSVVHASASDVVALTNVYRNSSSEFHSAEILSLNISAGDMPPGMFIRESPTKASRGGFLSRAVSGGYRISSFFDVFLELSVDGGATWWQDTDTLRLELWAPEEYYPYLELIPPPDGQYVSRADEVLIWPNGVMVKHMVHRAFTSSIPPPQGILTVAYGSVVEMTISMDGGLTWMNATAPALNTMSVSLSMGGPSVGFYDTEMLQMDISGGDLPPFMIIRESPTRPSTGRHNTRSFAPDAAVQSFFDVFLEISVDGGMTFTPPVNYHTLDLVKQTSVEVGLLRGWSLVSVPLEMTDYTTTALFPTTIYPWAFCYNPDSGYVRRTSLANGPGYWIKDTASSFAEMTGIPIHSLDVQVSRGWNIIGSISSPVAITSILSTPPGMDVGPFYDFRIIQDERRGYGKPDSIVPGKGYWVYVDSPGILTLSSEPSPEPWKKIRVVTGSMHPPSPPAEEVSSHRNFGLLYNYPNPFNPVTVIRYSLAGKAYLSLRVYDVTGRQVAVLADGMSNAGEYSVRWDAGGFPSGVYYCRMQTEESTRVLKLLLLK